MGVESWVVDPVTQEELWVPAWSTPERAFQRAALARAGGLRSIRFFNDWYHPWPLWEHSTAYPEDFGLSVPLGDALRDWHRVWEESVDPFTGWRSDADRAAWEAAGEALLEQLVREVWDIAQVDPARRLWHS